MLDELVSEFGERDTEGRRDARQDAGSAGIAFAIDERLERLNAITHPPSSVRSSRAWRSLGSRDPEGVLVVDAALLLDWDILDLFDLVLSVRRAGGTQGREARRARGSRRRRRARGSRRSWTTREFADAPTWSSTTGHARGTEETRSLDVWERVVRAREEQARMNEETESA